MVFVILGNIEQIETIAVGGRIRDHARLQRCYGRGRWRKKKGIALVRLAGSGEVFEAELHWYEATGIGQRELKIKRRLE